MNIIHIMWISVAVIGLLYIVFCFVKGCNIVKHKEKECTITVPANVKIIKEKHFFSARYYIVELSYVYEDKEYKVRKGYFKSHIDDKIDIFINPSNPSDCELLRIRDRLGIKPKMQ